MIWKSPTEGVYTSEQYVINRNTRGDWSAWSQSPPYTLGIGITREQAMQLCADDVKTTHAAAQG